MMITNDNDGAACNALDDVLLLRLFFDQAANRCDVVSGTQRGFLVTKQICCPFSGVWDLDRSVATALWQLASSQLRSMSPAVAAIETILGNIPYLGNKSEREPVGPKSVLAALRMGCTRQRTQDVEW